MQVGQWAPTTDAQGAEDALPDDRSLDRWRQRIRETTFGNYHLCMGLAIEAQGEPQAAEAHYRAALHNDPGCSAAFIRLQGLLEHQGRSAEAQAIAAQAVAINPAYLAEAELELARIYLDLSDIAACEAQLKSYLGRPGAVPLPAAALLQRIGELHAAHGRLEEAKRYTDQAIALAPDLVRHSLTLARKLVQDMRIDEAAAALDFYLKKNPGHAMAWHFAAIAAQMQDRLEDAIAASRESLRLLPQMPPKVQLGLSLLATGRLEDAEASLRKATAESGNQPWVTAILQWCLIAMNRLDAAAAIPVTTERDRSNLAILHLRAGRTEEAVRVLNQISDSDVIPLHRIWIDVNRCHVYLETGRLSEAEEAMRAAVSMSPQVARFYIRCRPWAAEQLMAVERKITR